MYNNWACGIKKDFNSEMGTEGGCTFSFQNEADQRGIYVRLSQASPGVGLYRGKSVLALL